MNLYAQHQQINKHLFFVLTTLKIGNKYDFDSIFLFLLKF
jgi:hypothetical protein